MAILQKGQKKSRPAGKARVVPFTVYLDPKFDRRVRAFAQKRDMTLTQMANHALDLFMGRNIVSN